MKISESVNQHGVAQQEYFGEARAWRDVPIEERAQLVQKMMSYIVEETVEVNRELGQHYKPFKKEKAIDNTKLLEELCDIYIYWMGAASIAGFTGEQIESAILAKLNYNDSRKDHNKGLTL